MGESAIDVLKNEHKMEEAAGSNPIIEVSVSFGRFENDALCWEKWSTFSPNKYLEEVEKCSTPGSVAQKKAYFEAHYKKIAARKAELLELQNQEENNRPKPFDENDEDLKNAICGIESRNLDSHEEISLEITSNESDRDEVEDKLDYKLDSQISSVAEKEEADVKSEEAAMENDVEFLSPAIEDPPSCFDDEKMAPEVEEKLVKLDPTKESKEATLVIKNKFSANGKKKPVKNVPKESKIDSTPRISKASSIYITPKTRSSAKRSDKLTLSSRSKIPSEGGGRRVAPKSLQMSLSLGSSKSHPPSLCTARKPVIMEKMGDKDIVKRAFKAFQSSFNQMKSSPEERSSAGKQVPVKRTEPRGSTSIDKQKENGRSLKTGGIDKRDGKANATSDGSKITEKADKQKGRLERPSSKDSERTRLQSKAKEAEIKKPRQNLNFKATPMPAFYRMQKLSKSTLDKEVPGTRLIE